jgi:hypothetical protein
MEPMPEPTMEPSDDAWAFSEPSFFEARREAGWILLAWAVCLAWTVGYSALAGYGVPGEVIRLVLGMPAWVFWGVLAPWAAATAFSVWFGLFVMKE